MPDFPNELVEAAAVVCYSLAPEHDTSTYPHGYVPYDEARPSSRENARADALEVLTALYPLIEQRVIDRLAREAGEPPYEEWNPTRAVWLEAVACGVAAERARWGAKQRQPEAVCDRCGAWKGLRAVGESCNTNCGGRVVAAALAPERTMTPEPEGENA